MADSAGPCRRSGVAAHRLHVHPSPEREAITVERTIGAASGRPLTMSTTLLWIHGLYYLLTGVWPLVSIHTFLLVTGPKTDHLMAPEQAEIDHWLVMTAGVLITAVALALLTAAWRRSPSPEAVVLALGAAAGLTAIDVIYVTRGVIQPIYLGDAAVEVVLILSWLVALARRPAR